MYTKAGKLKYCYNLVGLKYNYVESAAKLPTGEHQVRLEFKYDGGGPGRGANLELYVDGEQVGRGRIERSTPYLFSLDESMDVGEDLGTLVTDDYPAQHNQFKGKIDWVQIDLGVDDHSHMLDTEHMMHVRLTKQ